MSKELKSKNKLKVIKPFLRWAGGKTWFTKHIENFIPKVFCDYYEPFIGGGAIFFFLKSQGYIKNKAYLSDSNPDLINTYKILKNHHEPLFKILKEYGDSEEKLRWRLHQDQARPPSACIGTPRNAGTRGH